MIARRFDCAGGELAIVVQAAGYGSRAHRIERAGKQTECATISISSVTPLAIAISRAWPRKPKPVTSVHPCTSNCSMASQAARFSVSIEAVAASTHAGCAMPRFSAVPITPVPIALVKTSASPARAPLFGFTRSGMDGAGDRVAEFDFRIRHAVSAEHRAAGFAHFFESAEQDGFEHFRIAVRRESHDRKRRNRRAAHGVNIAQRVGGGDGAEGERIVDDRREEVDGLHQRQIGAQSIHSGVVGCVEADKDVRIGDSRHRAEHFVQQLWTQFRRSTGGFHVRGELT